MRKPTEVASKAWRRALRLGKRPDIWAVLREPETAGSPSDCLLAGIFERPLSEAEMLRWAEAQALRARARALLERRLLRWIWREIVSRLSLPLEDGKVLYPAHPGQDRFLWARNSPEDLGRLWARERREIGRRSRRVIERAFRQSLLGRRILQAAESAPDPDEYYGRDPEGRVLYRARDGVWYGAAEAAQLIAGARPWTRAELAEQFARHAKDSALAGEFYDELRAILGPGFLGLPFTNPAAAAELAAHEAGLPMLVQWVAAQLGVPTPEQRPILRPLTPADIAAVGRHDLMGVHVETDPMYIALARGAGRDTLVHELVHWTLTVTGERQKRGLSWAAEEALADQITARYRAAVKR